MEEGRRGREARREARARPREQLAPIHTARYGSSTRPGGVLALLPARAGPAFPGGALPVTAQHGSPRALDTAATSAYALDALMVPLESESH